MPDIETATFYPESKQDWREWLEKNHASQSAVWLVFYKKGANKPTLSWSEAVDEALCFGWIDSVKKTLDHERSIQFFSKRKPKSTWSKINKEKVKNLIESGQMTQAGLNCIEIAQKNGSWELLDDVEALVTPADLELALQKNPVAHAFYQNLSRSVKKAILHRLVQAKQAATREKRLGETIEQLNEQIVPRRL